MRTSGLMAGVFAVLIVAGAAFAGGYLMGKAEVESAPLVEVARDNVDVGPDLSQTTPQPRIDRPNLPPDTPDNPAHKTETPGPNPEDNAPAPVGTERPTLEAETSQPDDNGAPAPSAAEDAKSRVNKIADIRKKLDEKADALGEIEEGLFGGPRVDFTGTITGTVTDTSGTPVAGAEIRGTFAEQITSTGGNTSFGLALANGNNDGERLATTDGAGQFRVDINRKAGERSSMRVTLTAKMAGYAASSPRTVTLKNGGTQEGVNLALRTPAYLSGRVVDPSGRGVPGIEVSLTAAGDSGGFGGVAYRLGGNSDLAATTNGGGEYRIENVAEGRYRLQVKADGYREVSGPSMVEVKAGQDNRAPVDFVVEATASLRLMLQTIQGNPARTWVSVQLKNADGSVAKSSSASTDKNGTIVINDPPVGTFDAVIMAVGYKDYTAPVTIIEKLPCDLGTLTLELSKNVDPPILDD